MHQDERIRQRADDQRIDESTTVSPILAKNCAVIGALKIARGVTERKRSESALRESEVQL